MSAIRKTLFELLQLELSPSDVEGIQSYVSFEDILRVKSLLSSVTPAPNAGCCIFVVNDKYGRLYFKNIQGQVEDVLSKRVFDETGCLGSISDKELLYLVLQAIAYSGYPSYGEDYIAGGDDGIAIHKYHDYPCLVELVRETSIFDILPEIAKVEGISQRRRMPGYLDMYNIICAMDVSLLEPDGRTIFIEDDGDDVCIYGCPDDDELSSLVTRPIKVYSKEQAPTMARCFVLLIRCWSVEGVAFDQPEPYNRNLSNYFGMIARSLKDDIQRQGLRGLLPSGQDLAKIMLYQKLSYAYNVMHKYLHNKNHFKYYLDKAIDITSYRLETPESVDMEARVEFFEKTLSLMPINESSVSYNTVIMMFVTAPSSPIPNGVEVLQSLFHKYVEHEGVQETAFLHGHRHDKNEDARAVLYIFPCITTLNPIETA